MGDVIAPIADRLHRKFDVDLPMAHLLVDLLLQVPMMQRIALSGRKQLDRVRARVGIERGDSRLAWELRLGRNGHVY